MIMIDISKIYELRDEEDDTNVDDVGQLFLYVRLANESQTNDFGQI